MLKMLCFPNYFQAGLVISKHVIHMHFCRKNNGVHAACHPVKCAQRFVSVFCGVLVADSAVLLVILEVLSQPNNIKNEWYMLLCLSQKFLQLWPQCNHLSLSPDLWEPRALLFLCHLIQTALQIPVSPFQPLYLL